jgi:hypothetical protein
MEASSIWDAAPSLTSVPPSFSDDELRRRQSAHFEHDGCRLEEAPPHLVLDRHAQSIPSRWKSIRLDDDAFRHDVCA